MPHTLAMPADSSYVGSRKWITDAQLVHVVTFPACLHSPRKSRCPQPTGAFLEVLGVSGSVRGCLGLNGSSRLSGSKVADSRVSNRPGTRI